MNKYRFFQNLGILLSLALLAGCMQPLDIAGQASHESPRNERTRTDIAMKPLETEGSPLVPRPSEQLSPKAETVPLQADSGDASSFWQSGLASYYANRFQGKRTASGERYDLHALTAAHRTLPLGSYVRVTAVSSARSVIVRINDRGPYTHGRVIDLSYAAAAALDLPRTGTLPVTIESVTKQEAGT
ncbi:rare lipoprotein A [Paraburkholderia phenazinium]|uniref:Endolytic peptidoglycan transglycosylase RlpA n=2 Tax=Paraburkholderia phenazinium TaxID=60549 RepID=A0A1G7QEE1_9BURK|nr:rare lipoprotein A [Paraburkholderia phenazinium]